MKSFLKKAVSVVVILAVAFFFGKQFYYSFDALKGFDWNISYFYLAVAFAFFTAHLGLNIVQYYLTLRKMAVKPSLKNVGKARAFADLSGYVPGKVLLLLTRIKYLKKEVSTFNIAASTAFELMLVFFSASLLFLVRAGFSNEVFGAYRYAFYIAIVLCLILMHPGILSFFVNLLLKLMKKEPVQLGLSYGSVFMLALFYLIPWLLIGTAVYFIAYAIAPLSISLIPQITFYYAIAWAVGFLAFFVPSGLGVREGVLSYALSFLMPSYIAIIVAVLSRILLMAAQLLLAGLFAAHTHKSG